MVDDVVGSVDNGIAWPVVPGTAVSEQLIVRLRAADPTDVIATLGPVGTSSEMAGKDLAAKLGIRGDNALALCSSYEEARALVLQGRASRLLVANAYHEISEFYMDPALTLERAFVFDTPLYGLASRDRAPLPLKCRIVTHPAPRALINQLIPPGYGIFSVDRVSSTSAAAAQVAGGGADLALTTEPAARRHGLRFISPTRPIRMLWSVFVPTSEDERADLSATR